MSLFQKSVIEKFLNTLNKDLVLEKWTIYKNYFLNSGIQENIRNSKEEQYQGEFLIDLFVNVLGYTKNPTPNFNLTTELKNEKDSKKADGGIIINDKVVGVIELKGTNTTDLNKIEVQAFGYKNNQKDCVYVVTSNFEKLRFYIDNAIEHLEFNLFTLTEAEFKILYLCLAVENISKDIPKKIKEESVSQEDVITKKLYKDYSLFKRELFKNLVEQNPQFDQLELFKKSQKLLDRFLFILFAEDRMLLPPNSVRLILQQWKQLQDLDEYTPLYERFKKYFGYLNTGYKGKNYDVYAYNGGLFKPDAVLDNIAIDDKSLYAHTLKLSEYDFVSEVDVNILGHIFENSLNELDEIKAQLEGQEIDKTKTKRKKDGVFYTPKYITKYIVENTIGKLCEEKKLKLAINEEDYITDKKRQKKTIKDLIEKLDTYRKWLLQLTICDPACGSGAFLNQALDFLIEEHQYIDELQAKLFGDAMVLSDVQKSILENNLFGVDLNEESVEIAKLSLWLRTAQPNRKLNDLSGNIKCGNSLIDDPEIAGDKAFNWQTAFPRVFKEKNKKAWHITTAIHDSRTSQRMIDYQVREKRNMGTSPLQNISYLETEDEAIITQTLAEIVVEKKLNLLQYNICKDHMHMLLVCDDDELPTIMQHIKGKTARVHNSNKGINPLVQKESEKSVPLWTQKYGCNEITAPEQLSNTLDYIKHNRTKHKLPPHPKKIALLIENMLCTQEKAFEPEYKGGFDVIIGNPPYVRQELFKDIKPYLEANYKCYNSVADLYTYFIELGIRLINNNGKFSFILPNKFLKATYGAEIRRVMKNDSVLESLLDFDDYPVFDDATTYPIIFILNKINNNKNDFFYYSEINNRVKTDNPIEILETKKIKVPYISLTDEMWNFISLDSFKILEKLKNNSIILDKHVSKKIFYGIKTGKNEAFVIDEVKKEELISKNSKNAELIKVLATGKEVKRNSFNFQNKYLLFTGYDNDIPSNYPDIQVELDKFKQDLIKRYDQGLNYWNLRACAYYPEMQRPKIIYPRINNQGNFYFDAKGEVFLLDNNFFISSDSIGLLGLLNSKLVFYYLKNVCTTLQGGFYDFRRDKISTIPIHKNFNSYEAKIGKISQDLIQLVQDFDSINSKFQRTLQRKFDLDSLPKKLESWYELTFAEFVKELAKKKIKLSLSEEAEWEDYFLQEQQKALAIKQQITTTDQQIDTMVYELYGLTQEEINIIEST